MQEVKRTTIVCVCAMLLGLTLAACDQTPKVSDEDVQSLSDAEVVKAIAEPTTVMVDVRKPAAYAAGHIPGAINMYLPDIRPADARLGKAKQIIVYAGGWTDPLAPAAAKRMLSLGYQNVYDFKGGIENWQDAGHRLESSPVAAPVEARPETAP